MTPDTPAGHGRSTPRAGALERLRVATIVPRRIASVHAMLAMPVEQG